MSNKKTIAFLGTDGSGKSTIISALKPWVEEHYGFVVYEHMRPNFFPSLAVATGKRKASEESHTVCTNPHGSKSSGLLGSVIRLTYYWLDYTWGYYKKVYHSKDTIWFFDRYYYDYYVDQKRSRINVPKWILNIYGWFVPSPDLTICLGGDPSLIYSRKPETSLEEVACQNQILKKFAQKHKHSVWIDTTRTIDESVNAAKKAVQDLMSLSKE